MYSIPEDLRFSAWYGDQLQSITFPEIFSVSLEKFREHYPKLEQY